MALTTWVRKLLNRSGIFGFNRENRDRWVGMQAARLAPGARVLDVGAGSCFYRPLFSHTKYETQDFEKLRDEQCRANGYGQIDYVCDATQIPVSDAYFDVVLCTEVLEHLPEPILAIKEFARILKPGGQLLLTAPLGSGIHQEPYHYYGGFTPYWYQTFLPQYGFTDVQIEPNAGSFKYFSQEALRFLITTRPFATLPLPVSLAWLPFWIALVPVLGLLVPLACKILDRYDHEQRFTVGYHVIAIRS